MSNEDEDKRSEEREGGDESSAEAALGSPPDEAAEEGDPSPEHADRGQETPSSTKAEEEGADRGTSAASAAGKRLSAGARLAAQKAAKAAVKAAKKEERRAARDQSAQVEAEAPPVDGSDDPLAQLNESELGRAALKAGHWWERHAQIGWIALGAVALALVGFIAFTYHRDSQSAAAGTLLRAAIETASARIEASGERGGDEEDARTFPTVQARDEAALEAYQRVISQFPDHPSADVARLGAARALLALGRNDEAREAFQQAFDRGGRSGLIAWQALEGLGFAQEAADDLDGAQATYERLQNLENRTYASVATYHLARLQLRRGQQDAARNALRELVDSLRADTVEGSSEPRFPYVLAQAEVRLRELDPSSTSSGGPSLLGPRGGQRGEGGDIDPAQLQELIRRARQAGGEGGEGGGGE